MSDREGSTRSSGGGIAPFASTRDAGRPGRRAAEICPRSVRENAEGNRPPGGFFLRVGRRRGRRGRRTGAHERNEGRTGVSAGAGSLMVLLRSSGACERVSRSARGRRSREQAARAFRDRRKAVDRPAFLVHAAQRGKKTDPRTGPRRLVSPPLHYCARRDAGRVTRGSAPARVIAHVSGRGRPNVDYR